MKTYTSALILAVLGIGLAMPATSNAEMITFETASSSVTGFNGQSNVFQTEDGFNVEWFWGGTSGHSHLTSVGGSTVEANHNYDAVSGSLASAQGFRITKVGGGAFSLMSVDLAGQIAIGADSALNSAAVVTASSMSLLSNGSPGGALSTVSTIPSGFSNITELFFTDAYVVNASGGVGGWTGILAGNYIDNIVLGSVPEPASLGLMALVGGLGFYARRRFRI